MYIDPSAGGVIFQVLIVLFGFASGAVLMFSSRIKIGIAKSRRWLRERNQTDPTLEQSSIDDQISE